MTILGFLVGLFPMLHFISMVSAFVYFVVYPGILSGLLIPLSIYILPVLVMKLHSIFYPLEPGISNLSDAVYNPWWGSYNIQLIFNGFPMFEAALLLYSPLYSFWLRLWGAKVGKSVFFTPRLRIIDRSLITIGDKVVFGTDVIASSHVITPKQKAPILLVAPIVIESAVFIGAFARLAPGTHLKEGVMLKYNQVVNINEIVRNDSK